MAMVLEAKRKDHSQSRLIPAPFIAAVAAFIIWGPARWVFLALLVIAAVGLWELSDLSGEITARDGWWSIPIEWFLVASLAATPLVIRWAAGWPVLAITIAGIFASDVFGLYGGHRFGRHKLAPTISPGKTREGSLSGLIAALAVATIINLPTGTKLGWPQLLVGMTVIVIIGTLGDLNESRLKRLAGVKDSGHFMLGHGGMLDCIDAEIAALAAVALMVTACHYWAPQLLPH
jgi:phosphatidate cytidylyltransferase